MQQLCFADHLLSCERLSFSRTRRREVFAGAFNACTCVRAFQGAPLKTIVFFCKMFIEDPNARA